MNETFQLTIKNILQRDIFRDAKVIAGKKGIHNPIRWVHIMEVTEIGSLLNGNELILSTGIGWKDQPKLALSLLQQMIDKKVAGLCIELGTYVEHLPKTLIDLANKHQFPIIVFQKEVRFIDITQELNRLSIQNQYDLMLRLESVSNQFNHLLLSLDGFRRILRLLHQYLNVQVVYVDMEEKMTFYPPVEEKKREQYIERVKQAQPNLIINETTTSAAKPVQALGKKLGELVILSDRQLTDFDYLVLERAATALSLDQMRLLFGEEKRRQHENDWVLEWLRGEHEKDSIKQFLSEIEPNLHVDHAFACICELEMDNRDIDITYYSTLFQNVFEHYGFFLLTSYKRNHFILVALDRRDGEDNRSRLKSAVKKLTDNKMLNEGRTDHVRFVIGNLVPLEDLKISYQHAKETLHIQKKMNLPSILFYDDLYVYQMIMKLDKERLLDDLVQKHLGPVIEYDRRKNGEILETLRVLLEVNGSKKDAAERLYVVRQTLYHRIEKIKELLGEDFMRPEKRIAIELALYAKKYLDYVYA